MRYDLLICIRCHNHVDFTIDTYQAAQAYTSSNAEVVFAVDGGHKKFAQKMLSLCGPDRVYVAERRWGWGAGLYSLLIESYLYFRQRWEFNHYQSIDYDTLYIGPEADKTLLDSITSERIGLLGCYRSCNAHWEAVYKKQKEKFEKVFGKVPSSYIPGEGVQGGYMTLTASGLQAMEEAGMFEPPFANAKDFTMVADDHLLPIFIRMCGLDIKNVSKFAACYWSARSDPRGFEKKGIKLFHPTKLKPRNTNRSTEVEIRNYFRQVRKAPDLLK